MGLLLLEAVALLVLVAFGLDRAGAVATRVRQWRARRRFTREAIAEARRRMAERAGGRGTVTLELGADTEGFDRALREASATVRRVEEARRARAGGGR